MAEEAQLSREQDLGYFIESMKRVPAPDGPMSTDAVDNNLYRVVSLYCPGVSPRRLIELGILKGQGSRTIPFIDLRAEQANELEQ